MPNIKKYITIFCMVFAFVFEFVFNSAFAAPLKADAKTKRIPAGTTFKIEFLQPISTYSVTEGDSFTASISQDQTFGSAVLLPAGSIIRGSISKLKTAKRFSRGAVLYLDFDHVVTPSGRQIPLDLAICSFDKIYYDGGLYKNLGYGEALQNNYNKGVDITKKSTAYGMKVQESAPGLQYLTVPVCAVGGFFGGTGYLIGESIADMFKKGQDIRINAHDVMEVKLMAPIDIPVY